MKPKGKPGRKIAVGLGLLILGLVWYVRGNPRIFNESFFGHAHCIKMAGSALNAYTLANHDSFPAHTNGYGDALLLLAPDHLDWFEPLTGPCFSGDVFKKAKATGANIDEDQCGRVYVQGLKLDSNPDIALLFDKLPTPGDHCHFLSRLTRPFGREVWYVGGNMGFIRSTAWPAFAEKQIKLLIEAGIPEPAAKSYYENLPQ